METGSELVTQPGEEVVLGLELVTEGEAGPSWGNSEERDVGQRGPGKEGARRNVDWGVGGVGWFQPRTLPLPGQGPCMETHTWWGSPPPCPSLGLWGGLCGCQGAAMCPGALCWAPDLCVHRRIRGPAEGGGQGVGPAQSRRGGAREDGQAGRLGRSPSRLERRCGGRHRRGRGQGDTTWGHR